MNHLWAEVYDATYTTMLGDGPVGLINASVGQQLDGPGKVTVETLPLHRDFSKRPLDLLKPKRVVEVWWQEEPNPPSMRVAFVIDKVDFVGQPGTLRLSIRGADVLSLLKNHTTSLGLKYDDENISTVFADLAPAGWTASTSGVVGKVTARFDGTSVLKAMQAIAEQTGYHFRLEPGFKIIQMGPFGGDSGYRILKLEGDKPSPIRDDKILPLETIKIREDSSELYNKVIPLSAGDGDSRGTLEKSTESSPYTILTETGPDGRDIYYLEDTDSVTDYGRIERVLNFSKIAPIGTSNNSQKNTANYLYKAAVRQVELHKDPLEELSIRIAQPRVSLQVGDKVYVDYIEQVNVGGSPVTLKTIAGNYWVVGVDESYGDSGESARVELMNVDRTAKGAAKSIVEAVDGIEVAQTGYKATYNIWSTSEDSAYININQPATFDFTIPDDVLQVEAVTMRFRTEADQQWEIPSTPVFIGLSFFEEPVGAQYAWDMTLKVNGTSIATGVGTSATDQITGNEYDITDEILAAGSDGRGTHTITVETPRAGGGEVRVQCMIRATIVPGKL